MFTISLLGLLSIPLYAGLLLLLVVAGALRASNVYKEQLGSYLKEENIGLFTLALGSIVTTTGRVRDSCSFCIYRLLYRWQKAAGGAVSTILALHKPCPGWFLGHICAIGAHLPPHAEPQPPSSQQPASHHCACHHHCHRARFFQLFFCIHYVRAGVNDGQTMQKRTKEKKCKCLKSSEVLSLWQEQEHISVYRKKEKEKKGRKKIQWICLNALCRQIYILITFEKPAVKKIVKHSVQLFKFCSFPRFNTFSPSFTKTFSGLSQMPLHNY